MDESLSKTDESWDAGEKALALVSSPRRLRGLADRRPSARRSSSGCPPKPGRHKGSDRPAAGTGAGALETQPSSSGSSAGWPQAPPRHRRRRRGARAAAAAGQPADVAGPAGSRPASPAPGSSRCRRSVPTTRSSDGPCTTWPMAARPARDPPQGVRLGRLHLHPLRGGVAASKVTSIPSRRSPRSSTSRTIDGVLLHH